MHIRRCRALGPGDHLAPGSCASLSCNGRYHPARPNCPVHDQSNSVTSASGVFAAPAIHHGFPEAQAYYLGKVLECASFCAEPYGGKGVRYRGENIRRKAGKAAKGKGK